MKTLLKAISIFSLSFIFFSSCKKEKELTIREKMLTKNAGVVSVDMNGKPWAHSVVLATSDVPNTSKFGLSVYLFGTNEYYSDDLEIFDIDCALEKNIVHDAYISEPKGGTKAMFTNVDYDVARAIYKLIDDSSQNNHVKIESYNSATKEVKGSFQLSFYFSGGELQPGYADTLRLTNGQFNVKISPPQ